MRAFRVVLAIIVMLGVFATNRATLQANGCYANGVNGSYTQYFSYCSAADCSQGMGQANLQDCNGYFEGSMASECAEFCDWSAYPEWGSSYVTNYQESGSSSSGTCICLYF
jgi:hypothetical protein